MGRMRAVFAKGWHRVVVACAALFVAGGALAAEEEQGADSTTRYILAVCWQPGFCEIRPQRQECREQTAERFDARHFSLHGLWPLKKSYCGIAADLKARDRKGRWADLPAVALADDVASRLRVAMPGVASGLDRHQWIRSGTCMEKTADEYFGLSLALLDQLNGSPVQALFAANLGQTLSEERIRQAFDQSFGAGAGDRVRMRCQKDGDRLLITGLTIGLSEAAASTAVVADNRSPDMGALILAAGPTKFNCAAGLVDAAGQQ